jgi:hypothetical protein
MFNLSFLIIPFRAEGVSMVMPAQHPYSYNDANTLRGWFTAYSNMKWLNFTRLRSAFRLMPNEMFVILGSFRSAIGIFCSEFRGT